MTGDRYERWGFCPPRVVQRILEETRSGGYLVGYLAALDLCLASFEQMSPLATLDDVKQLVQQLRDGEVVIPPPSS